MCEEKILGFYMCHLQIWELFNNNYLCTYDLYGPMRNAFDAGSIHYFGKWEGGWALEIEFFCEMATSLEAIAIWGTLRGPTPSSGPRNEYCLHQNHYVPRHINNRYIKS